VVSFVAWSVDTMRIPPYVSSQRLIAAAGLRSFILKLHVFRSALSRRPFNRLAATLAVVLWLDCDVVWLVVLDLLYPSPFVAAFVVDQIANWHGMGLCAVCMAMRHVTSQKRRCALAMCMGQWANDGPTRQS
jgi:hypothetical protein